MKSLPILALLSGACLLFSCKKEHDTPVVITPDTNYTDTSVYPRGNYNTYYRGDTVGEPSYVDYIDYMEDGITIRRIKSISPATDSTVYSFSYNSGKQITQMLTISGPAYSSVQYDFFYKDHLLDSIAIDDNDVPLYMLVKYDEQQRVANYNVYKKDYYTDTFYNTNSTFFFRNQTTGSLDSTLAESYDGEEIIERFTARFDTFNPADSVVRFDPAYLLVLATRTDYNLLNADYLNLFSLQFLHPNENTFRQSTADYWTNIGKGYTNKRFPFTYTLGANKKLNYFLFNGTRYLSDRPISIRL